MDSASYCCGVRVRCHHRRLLSPTQTLKAAEGSVPYYEVAEINVKDQAGYEASGVKDVRASQDALGGVLVAGGYNKATGFLGDPPANRYLIIRYPSKKRPKNTGTTVSPNGGTARATSTRPSAPSAPKA